MLMFSYSTLNFTTPDWVGAAAVVGQSHVALNGNMLGGDLLRATIQIAISFYIWVQN